MEASSTARYGMADENAYDLAAGFQSRCSVQEASPCVPATDLGPKCFPNRPLRMHQDSSQVQNLFNPSRGIRDVQKRAGKVPVNHAKNNRRAIAAQSQQNAARKIVRSLLLEEAQSAALGRTFRRSTSLRGSTAGTATRPRTPPDGRDYVHENIIDAGTHKKEPTETKDNDAKYLSKANYGQVPSYLHERNMELAANYAKQQAAKEAALIPPGMRIMPESERLETLSILDQNREDVMREIQQLPFIIETPSAVKHKNHLEQRLQEIEEAHKIFSRSKVLVKI